jgi:hypothetical protein
VHVPHAVAENGQAFVGLLSHLEGVGGIPEDAERARARRAEHAERVRRAREVAVRLDPDFDALRPRRFSKTRQRVGDPRARRLPVLSGLDAVAEHADAGSAELRGQGDRSSRFFDGRLPRDTIGIVEERTRVHAGDLEPRVAKAGQRVAQAGTDQLGARP